MFLPSRHSLISALLIGLMLSPSVITAARAEVPLPEQQPGTPLPVDDGSGAAKQKAKKPVPDLPEDNLPDDVQACFNNNDPQLRVVACTHAIEGHQAVGDMLSASYFNRAIGYSLMNKNKLAIKDFGLALDASKNAPNSTANQSRIYLNRGMARMRVNQMTKQVLAAAKQDFDAALSRDKDSVDARYFRAWVESQQGSDTDAIADLSNILSQHPDHMDALLDRGGLLLRNSKFDAAIADFTAMIKLDSKGAAAFYNRGRANFAKGDFAAASVDFSSAMSLRNSNPYAALRLNLARQFEAQAAKKATHNAGDAKALESAAKPLLDDQWPVQMLRYFQGKMDQTSVFNVITSNYPVQGNGLRCEFNYYLGQQALLKGDKKAAKTFFSAAVATKSTTTVEFIDSNLALKALGS